MSRTSNLSRPIIEALYEEALVLADEIRAVFALGVHEAEGDDLYDANARLALSTEGLKTTTRIMHVLAWLLNQRAFFSGELSETQVRRHGALPPNRPSDAKALAMLNPGTRELIGESERLHDRVARLDEAWRSGFEAASPAHALTQRIERSLRDFG